MKPLTEDDFTLELTELIIHTGVENGDEIKQQILKNQEDAEFGRNWKQFLEDNPMIIREYPEFSKIVEQIKKRIKELRYQLDHTQPDYKRSISLQEHLQEMVNLIGFEKYEEIMVGKK